MIIMLAMLMMLVVVMITMIWSLQHYLMGHSGDLPPPLASLNKDVSLASGELIRLILMGLSCICCVCVFVSKSVRVWVRVCIWVCSTPLCAYECAWGKWIHLTCFFGVWVCTCVFVSWWLCAATSRCLPPVWLQAYLGSGALGLTIRLSCYLSCYVDLSKLIDGFL